MQDVQRTVFDIIARKANADSATFSRDTELAGLDLDSVDTVEVIFEIEEAFNISLLYNANATQGGNPKTVGDVVDLVAAQLGAGNAAPAPP